MAQYCFDELKCTGSIYKDRSKGLYTFICDNTNAKHVKIASNKKLSASDVTDINVGCDKDKLGVGINNYEDSFTDLLLEAVIEKKKNRREPYIFINAYPEIMSWCSRSNNFKYIVNVAEKYGVTHKIEVKNNASISGKDTSTYCYDAKLLVVVSSD